jgi:LPXTG-motif cell wall-anchored protein
MPLNAPTAAPQLSIVDQLKAKLNELKDKIKEGGLHSAVYTEISNNAKLIQDKLNELLSKKGLLSQSDVNDAYSVIQDVKRSELESQSKKSSTKLLIYVGAAILIIGGVLFYKKRK